MKAKIHLLSPKVLGFWIRCVRETSKMSQDALAEASNLNIRTVQRVESGEPANVTTRRCLAKGLGYDNKDIFDNPEFAKTVMTFLEQIRKAQEKEYKAQFPEHLTVTASPVKTGDELLALADSASAYCFYADEKLSKEAREVVDWIFDYLNNFDGILSEVSFSQKTGYANELGSMQDELRNRGAHLYTALRQTKIVGENWIDKTPMTWTIRYLTAVPINERPSELLVPKDVV